MSAGRPNGHPTLSEAFLTDIIDHDSEAAEKLTALLRDATTGRRELDMYTAAVIGLAVGVLRRNVSNAVIERQRIMALRIND